jgi:hypothetical protein
MIEASCERGKGDGWTNERIGGERVRKRWRRGRAGSVPCALGSSRQGSGRKNDVRSSLGLLNERRLIGESSKRSERGSRPEMAVIPREEGGGEKEKVGRSARRFVRLARSKECSPLRPCQRAARARTDDEEDGYGEEILGHVCRLPTVEKARREGEAEVCSANGATRAKESDNEEGTSQSVQQSDGLDSEGRREGVCTH